MILRSCVKEWFEGRGKAVFALFAAGVVLADEITPKPTQPTPSLAAASNPYQRISARNLFGIRPPAPPAAAPEPVPETPKERPDFFLSGFTRIGGKSRAFIAYQLKGKPMEFPEALMEGVEVDGITLLGIDESLDSVQIQYNGEPITLDFEKNGMKGTVVPSGGAPGAPSKPSAGQTVPSRIVGVNGIAPVSPLGGPLPRYAGGAQTGGATLIGRGGVVQGGYSGSLSPGNFSTGAGLPSIQLGATPGTFGSEVQAIQPATGDFGSTIPVNPIRNQRPTQPAPFPFLPGGN
ncbi:MAG: hypothetical protein EXS25_04325 [Pedosphaera sp.]|nr:hypothetical protein [Pedosphaera sp.]